MAHRLRTIADSDLIVVVNDGIVKEIGDPLTLLKNNDSLFWSLANESGEPDEIFRIAKDKISISRYQQSDGSSAHSLNNRPIEPDDERERILREIAKIMKNFRLEV